MMASCLCSSRFSGHGDVLASTFLSEAAAGGAREPVSAERAAAFRPISYCLTGLTYLEVAANIKCNIMLPMTVKSTDVVPVRSAIEAAFRRPPNQVRGAHTKNLFRVIIRRGGCNDSTRNLSASVLVQPQRIAQVNAAQGGALSPSGHNIVGDVAKRNNATSTRTRMVGWGGVNMISITAPA